MPMLTLTDKNFDAYLEKYAGKAFVVMFWAVFAGPCIAAKETFTRFQSEVGNKVVCGTFDLEGNVKTPERYGVNRVPVYILFIDGEPVDIVGGNVPVERLKEMLNGG